jgi:glycosyltransferase involved in cell wall biosynthesis
MSKIRILAIPSDQHGVGKFRILDPYKYLAENHSDDVHVDISFNVEDNDESFLNYDIVVLHSFIHQLPHEFNVKRINWLKSKGIKVVVDTDDLWVVDQRHPMYNQIKANKIAEKKVELLKLADYVTTTTPIYAQTIKNRLGIKNVSVFPNAVNPDEPQFQPNPTKSDKVRFGWLGGSSHLHDIELMSTGISSIHNSYKDKVQFVLCGFDLRGTVTEMTKDGQQRKRNILPHETIWFRYENMFTDKYKAIDEEYKNYLLKFSDVPFDDNDKPYIRKWTQEINKYAHNYNSFDVSLAPLVESEFNMNKSQLKIIEAGFHKKAIIASDVKPYTLDLISAIDSGSNEFNSKGNSLLVPPSKNHKLWSKHMKRLIDNPNMIEDMGNRLYETVKDKYSLKNVSKDRVEFLKSIINN